MSGVFLRQEGGLVAMVETPYEEEMVLQELLAGFPALLTSDASEGEEWLLIRREAAVGLGDQSVARGYVDHLFVDSAGVPTLVEVKRSSDTRVRREVVGQMLDYAANAAARWGHDDTVERWFEERCAARGEDPEQALLDTFPGVATAASFWAQVRTNLAAERLRLVFVADAIPSELRRIVEFLNGQLTQTEVLAIEVKQYRDATGRHETIVPRVLGRTESARQVKADAGRRWTRDEIIEQVRGYRNEEEAALARRLFDWAAGRGDLKEWFGSGKKDGSFQAGYTDRARYLFPFALYGYGRVEIQFQYMMRRPPFDDEGTRRELLEKLNAIPGVHLGDDALTKRPSIALAELREGDALDRLTAALDWTYDRANALASNARPNNRA